MSLTWRVEGKTMREIVEFSPRATVTMRALTPKCNVSLLSEVLGGNDNITYMDDNGGLADIRYISRVDMKNKNIKVVVSNAQSTVYLNEREGAHGILMPYFISRGDGKVSTISHTRSQIDVKRKMNALEVEVVGHTPTGALCLNVRFWSFDALRSGELMYKTIFDMANIIANTADEGADKILEFILSADAKYNKFLGFPKGELAKGFNPRHALDAGDDICASFPISMNTVSTMATRVKREMRNLINEMRANDDNVFDVLKRIETPQFGVDWSRRPLESTKSFGSYILRKLAVGENTASIGEIIAGHDTQEKEDSLPPVMEDRMDENLSSNEWATLGEVIEDEIDAEAAVEKDDQPEIDIQDSDDTTKEEDGGDGYPEQLDMGAQELNERVNEQAGDDVERVYVSTGDSTPDENIMPEEDSAPEYDDCDVPGVGDVETIDFTNDEPVEEVEPKQNAS